MEKIKKIERNLKIFSWLVVLLSVGFFTWVSEGKFLTALLIVLGIVTFAISLILVCSKESRKDISYWLANRKYK